MRNRFIKRLLIFVFVLVSFIQYSAFAVESRDNSLPVVSAKSAVLIDRLSGDVIYDKNKDERLPMASTTKIMTALVAIENCDIDSIVTVSAEAVGVEGSSLYLKENSSLTMRDLLYGLLLQSANDAAEQIALEVSGSVCDFVELMNKKASELGLRDTHFTNPHGLPSEEHFTTAHELAIITSAAMNNSLFCEIVSSERKTITIDGEERLLVNHNKLLSSYDGAVGVKTGFTKTSGRCLVSSAERDGVSIIAVTLDAPDDWRDHSEMLDYGFSVITRRCVAQARKIYFDLPIISGNCSSVRCSNRDAVFLTLKDDSKISIRIESDRFFPAPVNIGDALAQAVVSIDGKDVVYVPLYAEHSVEKIEGKLSLRDRILKLFGK